MKLRPFVFLFAPALLALGTIGAACGGGNGDNYQPAALDDFLEDVKRGNVESVEVDGRDIYYNLTDDEVIFKARMEEGDTLRQIMEDAGIDPQQGPRVRFKQNGYDVNGGGARHYENAELGFALDYPNDWEQIKEPLRAAEEIGEADTLASVLLGRLVEDPLHLEGMGVTVYQHRSTPEEDVEEAVLELDALIAQLMGQAGGAIAEADWTELGGVMARRYVLNFPHPVGVPMTSEKVVTFRGDLQFELDCQAVADRFQDVEAECQVVLDSFEFTSEQ